MIIQTIWGFTWRSSSGGGDDELWWFGWTVPLNRLVLPLMNESVLFGHFRAFLPPQPITTPLSHSGPLTAGSGRMDSAFFPVLHNTKHLKRKLLRTETLMGNGKLHCFLCVGASSSSRNRLHSPFKDTLRVWSWWSRRCASSATFHFLRIPRLDWE